MRPPLATRFRGLLTFLAVAIAAAIAGTGIGAGLSKLSGSDGGDASPAEPVASSTTTTTSTPAADTATATASVPAAPAADTTPQSATPADIPQGAAVPQVRVISAVLFPASTASGRTRQRARISVRVRVTNRDSKPLTPPNPLLLTGSDRIAVDTRADDAAGALLNPIAPSQRATGELRFEVAGAVTRRLNAKPRARLAIVNRIVALKIRISPTPPPPG